MSSTPSTGATPAWDGHSLFVRPNTAHERERRCARGERCVCAPAAVLSIYNAGPYCYCCDRAVTQERKAAMHVAEPVEGHLSDDLMRIEDERMEPEAVAA